MNNSKNTVVETKKAFPKKKRLKVFTKKLTNVIYPQEQGFL